MDYQAAIEHVYDHLENDHVDKAVMTCLRIARNLQDYVNAAIFLREMYPDTHECTRLLYDDISHLTDEAKNWILKTSAQHWLDIHDIDFAITDDEDKTVVSLAITEIDSDIKQCEGAIADLAVPDGMGEYDTAAFTDRNVNQKADFRLRIRGLHQVKQRVKNRCLNYAIRIERQLQAQAKSQNFLAHVQTEVNNYFKAHSEDVYTKLQKAAQLVDSNDTEDCSLLLTQVRRAIKAAADFFYPPTTEKVTCFDGKERVLNDGTYLNRLTEYLLATFATSSSQDLLRSELEHLSVFARRLNDVASKGVHADVSPEEAKQGILGLYMFLYNVTSRLQRTDTSAATQPNPEGRP